MEILRLLRILTKVYLAIYFVLLSGGAFVMFKFVKAAYFDSDPSCYEDFLNGDFSNMHACAEMGPDALPQWTFICAAWGLVFLPFVSLPAIVLVLVKVGVRTVRCGKIIIRHWRQFGSLALWTSLLCITLYAMWFSTEVMRGILFGDEGPFGEDEQIPDGQEMPIFNPVSSQRAEL